MRPVLAPLRSGRSSAPADTLGRMNRLDRPAVFDDGQSESGARRVGVPIQEAALTARLVRSAGNLFPPGRGHSSWLLLEPLTGFGIPDALIIRTSPTSLKAHMSRGLRLPNYAAAKALAADDDASSGLSERHARALRRNLWALGWTTPAIRKAAQLVSDSLAIEVKLEDARQAVRQAGRFRVSAHRSAILMPSRTAHRAPKASLDHLGIGLLVSDDDGIRWDTPATMKLPSLTRRLWLAELLTRSIEGNAAYTLSASRNRMRASDIARTLEE